MFLMQIIKYVQVFQFAVCRACSKISADVIYLFNQEQKWEASKYAYIHTP